MIAAWMTIILLKSQSNKEVSGMKTLEKMVMVVEEREFEWVKEINKRTYVGFNQLWNFWQNLGLKDAKEFGELGDEVSWVSLEHGVILSICGVFV